MLTKISASFSTANSNVLVRDRVSDTPLRIYLENGALLSPIGLTTTDAAGKVDVWVSREVNFPEILLLSSSGELASEVAAPPSASGPALGEIRYFASQPSDSAWLKCDGTAYLRSDYPEYEGMRPTPAIVFEDVTATLTCTPWDYLLLADGSFLYIEVSSYPSKLCRTTDNFATKTELPGLGPGVTVFCFAQLPSGRLVAVSKSRDVHYSDDLGSNWTTVTNALPASILSSTGFLPFNLTQFITGAGTLQLPIPGTTKCVLTTNGVVWTEVSMEYFSNRLATNPSVTTNPSVLGSYKSHFWPDTALMLFGAALYPSENIYFYADPDWAEMDTSGVPTTLGDSSRPGIVHAHLDNVGGKTYEICMGFPGILFGDANNEAMSVAPSSNQAFLPEKLTYVGSHPIAVRGSPEPALFGWLSPDGLSLESSEIPSLGPIGIACLAPVSGAALMFARDTFDWHPIRTKISLDPAKFQAPGLAPKANTHPYVYTRA